MELEYEFRFEDVIASNEERFRCNSGPRSRTLPLFMAALVAVLMFGVFGGGESKVKGVVVGGLTGVIAYVSWGRIARRSFTESVSRVFAGWEEPVEIGPRTLSLTPKSVIIRGPMQESVTSWAAVKRVCQSKKHLFLHIGPLSVVTIPVFRLVDPSSGADLAEKVREYSGKTIETV
nr:hypothetical protein [uncultured bacterium]